MSGSSPVRPPGRPIKPPPPVPSKGAPPLAPGARSGIQSPPVPSKENKQSPPYAVPKVTKPAPYPVANRNSVQGQPRPCQDAATNSGSVGITVTSSSGERTSSRPIVTKRPPPPPSQRPSSVRLSASNATDRQCSAADTIATAGGPTDATVAARCSDTTSSACGPRGPGSVRSRPPPRPAGPPPRRAATVRHSSSNSGSTTTGLVRSTTQPSNNMLTKPVSPSQQAPPKSPGSSSLKDLGVEQDQVLVPPDRPAPVSGKDTVRSPGSPAYVVACDYTGENEQELSAVTGAAIMLLDDENENGWVLGIDESGREGYLPITFLED